MTRLAQACLRGDFETRAASRPLPAAHERQLRGVQPHSSESPMGLMGCWSRSTAADDAAQPANLARIAKVLEAAGLLRSVSLAS